MIENTRSISSFLMSSWYKIALTETKALLSAQNKPDFDINNVMDAVFAKLSQTFPKDFAKLGFDMIVKEIGGDINPDGDITDEMLDKQIKSLIKGYSALKEDMNVELPY